MVVAIVSMIPIESGPTTLMTEYSMPYPTQAAGPIQAEERHLQLYPPRSRLYTRVMEKADAVF